MFTCCHPVLSTEARVALTLRLLGGLTTPEIARAFLVAEATVAQRIVRAKRTLTRGARCRSRCRRGGARRARSPRVLEVVYLDLQRGLRGHGRRRLDAARALRGRAAPGPHPRRARAARAGGARPGRADGDPGLAHGGAGRTAPASRSCCSTRTARAGTAPDRPRPRGAAAAPKSSAAPLGPYGLQAAIAACHARARTAEDTDWVRIAALYDALAAALALAGRRAEPGGRGRHGLRAGGGPRRWSNALADEPALRGYHLLPAVRGDLLAKLDRRRRGARPSSRAPPP